MSHAPAGTTYVDRTSTMAAMCSAAAPDIPDPTTPTVPQAHEIMQCRLRCITSTCAYRRAALAVLVGAGRYILP